MTVPRDANERAAIMSNHPRVAGIAAATLALLAAGACSAATTPPGAGRSPSGLPSSAVPPSAAPPPAAPSSAAARPIPASVPDQAFLLASDVPGTATDGPNRVGSDAHPLPELCGKDYENKDRVGVRGMRSVAFVHAGAPAGSVPAAMIYQEILVFRGDGAKAFLDDLAAAVKSCPSGDKDRKFRLLEAIGAGNQSLLFEQTSPARGDDGELTGNAVHRLFWAAVRVGDAVTVVSNTGWESGSAERADTEHLGRRAAARLALWRGR
jgi:hypothetical protein